MIALFAAMPLSVALGNVLNSLMLVLALLTPRASLAAIRSKLSWPVILMLLALPAVVAVFLIGADNAGGDPVGMVTKQRKVLLMFALIAVCAQGSIFERARAASWMSSVLLAVLSIGFMLADYGLNGPFDPERPVVLTHSYQNFIVGFNAVWMALWTARVWPTLARWQRLVLTLAIALMAFSILFVVTGRTGQLAFVAMAVAAIMMSLRRYRLVALVAMVTLSVAAAMASPQVRDRYLSIADSLSGSTELRAMAGTLRIDFARKTAKIIASSPWVGYGTGSFPQVYESVAGVPRSDEFFTYHPHSDLMLYWVEAGLAGVLAVLLLYAGLLKGARELDPENRIVLSVLVCGFVVCGFTHSFVLDWVSGSYLYLTGGLLLATRRGRAP